MAFYKTRYFAYQCEDYHGKATQGSTNLSLLNIQYKILYYIIYFIKILLVHLDVYTNLVNELHPDLTF